MTSFWVRVAGSRGHASRRRPTGTDAGRAFGDNLGGLTIAGGVAAALYARTANGGTSVIDVSLLGWAPGLPR